MGIKSIYEFLVWDNCNNNCSFCHQRGNPRVFPLEQREIILNETIKFIDSDKFEWGSHILICGGEIFDNDKDIPHLYGLWDSLMERMRIKQVDLLYINTNLLYENKSSLQNLLELIKEHNLFDRLKFTTSFDIEGRFHTPKRLQMFLDNLLWVKETYPDCNIVVNTILTKPMCDAILNNVFEVDEFMNTYKCYVNLLPYIVYDDSLTPTREYLYKTLLQVFSNSKLNKEQYINNLLLEQDRMLYVYIDGKYEFRTCNNSECGHSINMKRYSTNNSCFCCDIVKLLETI